MSVIAGLRVVDAPAINARKTGQIAWGPQQVLVTARAHFPSSYPNQVWYRVQLGNTTGWIPARFSGQDFVVGGDACLNNNIPSVNQFDFMYDRAEASRYGIVQSYQNSDLTGAALGPRVTKRVSNPTPVPFANFDYTGIVQHGQTGFTGSALFVSEAIWIGGLPMTIDDDLQGNPNINSYCSVLPVPPDYPEANYRGWRYCPAGSEATLSAPVTGPQVTVPWRLHNALGSYFSTPGPAAPNTINSQVLEAPYKGRRIGSFLLTEPPLNGYIDDAIDRNAGGARNLRRPDLALWAKTNLSAIKAGDYLWINSGPEPKGVGGPGSDFHGFLIAGWGEIETCATALGRVYQIGSQYTSTTILVARPPEDVPTKTDGSPFYLIPYVVDFAGAKDNRIQRPIPRPFYCSWYADPISTTLRFFSYGHSWFFYTVADQVSISANQLYVYPDWEWSASAGQ
jgi:hypothetical protein